MSALLSCFWCRSLIRGNEDKERGRGVRNGLASRTVRVKAMTKKETVTKEAILGAMEEFEKAKDDWMDAKNCENEARSESISCLNIMRERRKALDRLMGDYEEQLPKEARRDD